MTKYYKVTNKYLQSCVISSLPTSLSRVRSLCTTYKVGEWVEKPYDKFKLMVYNDLFEAKKWIFQGSNRKLFECEVDGISNESIFIENPYRNYTLLEEDDLFTDYSGFLLTSVTNKKILEGTVFCDRVKLTKEITHDN